MTAVREARREFEDLVYFEASRLSGLKTMVDNMVVLENENCTELSDNCDTQIGGV